MNPRDEARLRGDDTYYDPEPCERGHRWSHRVSDGCCLMCPDVVVEVEAPPVCDLAPPVVEEESVPNIRKERKTTKRQGRPPKYSVEQRAMINRLYDQGATHEEIALQLGISKPTVNFLLRPHIRETGRRLGLQDAAKAAGEATYMTDEPCPHGHRGPRYTSSRECVECAQAKQRTHGTMEDRTQASDERALRYLAMLSWATMDKIAELEGISRQRVHQLIERAREIQRNEEV